MKKILITGAHSYVGTSLERYLAQWPQDFQVETVGMVDGSWRERSFRGYDAVFHVAGIVHRKDRKDDPAQAALYRQVNRDLAVETAKKARAEGVGQFLFMSSASVYGLTAPMGKLVMIGRDTPVAPVDNYGISKAEAEQGLLALAGEGFKMVILRPPMIYGRGCKGNYRTLSKLAGKLPVFPWVDNQRSMLYIDNLSELVRLLIEDGAEGIFCPQNSEYSNTAELAAMIARARGRKLLVLRGFGWALRLLRPVTGMVDKAFGSLCYDRSLSEYPKNYCVKSLAESVAESEK